MNAMTHVLTERQRRELATAEKYLAVAEKDLADYHNKTDLIGRALRDIRDHMANTLEKTRQRFGLEASK